MSLSATIDIRKAHHTGMQGGEQPMSIKKQVQYLIEEATEPKNLAQGESITHAFAQCLC